MHAAGLVIRDLPLAASNWRSEETLDAYLRRNNIVGIAEIDTRKLTRILRDTGAQNGCLVAGANISEDDAIAAAQAFPGLKGMDLAKVVSVKERYSWREGSYDLDKAAFVTPSLRFRVVAYDFGIKRNILRMLVDRGCDVTVVPAQTPASEVFALRPDGVLLANGPGDPGAVRLRDRRDPRVDPREGPDVRHLPRPPAARSRRRRENDQDEVRPSRRESSGHRPRQRPRDDLEPEPRLRGRRGDAAGERESDAPFAVRRIASGHKAHRRTGFQFPGASRGESRARTTWPASSTSSSS